MPPRYKVTIITQCGEEIKLREKWPEIIERLKSWLNPEEPAPLPQKIIIEVK